MRTIRNARSIVLALALFLLPTLALAEVSVVLDHQGQFKRLVVLTRGRGRSTGYWSQVRPGVLPGLMLNPLGDNRGDGPPVVQFNPVTGAPWVFWSMNIANQKRIAFSFWNGKAWNVPGLIVADPGPYFYDELDPAVAFGPDGALYLFWWRPEQAGGRVYFSTLIGGRWSPPLLLSNEGVDSRRPAISLAGTTATITYRTPSGPVTKIFDTAVLVQSASNLMDTPLPPGQTKQGDNQGGGGGSDSGGKQKH